MNDGGVQQISSSLFCIWGYWGLTCSYVALVQSIIFSWYGGEAAPPPRVQKKPEQMTFCSPMFVLINFIPRGNKSPLQKSCTPGR